MRNVIQKNKSLKNNKKTEGKCIENAKETKRQELKAKIVQ